MVKVWVLTNGLKKEERTKPSSAADIFKELQTALGDDVLLVHEEDVIQRSSTESGLTLFIGSTQVEKPKIALVRIGSDRVSFTFPLLEQLEKMGIVLINNLSAIRLATNKALTYQELALKRMSVYSRLFAKYN
jgi:glutathione synthase/RimK-type ligase-like ATP-grasp enzyme